MLKFKTIQTKMLIIFSASFFVLLIILLMVNGLLLEPFYLNRNIHKFEQVFTDYHEHLIRITEVFDDASRLPLETSSNQIRPNVTGAPPLFSEGPTAPEDGVEIAPGQMVINDIKTQTGAILYVVRDDLTLFQDISGPVEVPAISKDLLEEIMEQALASEDKGYHTIIERGSLNDQLLLYGKFLDNGHLVLVTKAMGFVHEAGTIFLVFLSISAVVVYIIGLVAIFIIAKGFTRPISNMKNITVKLSELDFNQRLEVNSEDELGQLADSINHMALQLSENIDTLNITNEQLQRELMKEKTLEKMRRRFVSDVSHELKNPLSIIMGYADGLKAHIPKTEADKNEYYQIILDEASSMNQLIKDLLDLSSYESGTFSIQREMFDLTELVDDSIKRLLFATKEKQVHVKVTCRNGKEMTNQPVLVMADRLRISQVVTNLLNNAFKHVDDGGKIQVEINKQDHCEMVIRNTGALIPVEELDNIWESFYQVDNTKKGSGLGLAIVRSIIQLHQGSCEAFIHGDFNCFSVRF